MASVRNDNVSSTARWPNWRHATGRPRGAIDQLDISLGLLAEHDAEIADRDPVLFDGLPMQIPDRRAATEQDDDDERDADRHRCRPERELLPRTQRRRTRPASVCTPQPPTYGRSLQHTTRVANIGLNSGELLLPASRSRECGVAC